MMITFFLQLKARPEVYVPPEAKQPLTPPAQDSAQSNNQAAESQKTLLQPNLQGKATHRRIHAVSIKVKFKSCSNNNIPEILILKLLKLQ